MNIEEIRENQLQKAEENLNDKKIKIKKFSTNHKFSR